MTGFLFVALGGALGASFRYGISLIPWKGTFPVLTLITNILGAVLIGLIVGIASGNGKMSDSQILFWKTGVCGGFTTFSTFSLEAMNLLEQGKTAYGVLYIIFSVLAYIVGVYLGRMLGTKKTNPKNHPYLPRKNPSVTQTHPQSQGYPCTSDIRLSGS